MKQLFSFLMFVCILSSCSKKSSELDTLVPVTFTYSSPKCERPQITFTGEKYGDVTTITQNTVVNLRSDQKYTVHFNLTTPRCSSGEIILNGSSANEVNFWLTSFPASAEKLHVNLESNYYVVVLGE